MTRSARDERREIQAAMARFRSAGERPATPGDVWRRFEAIVDLARLGVVEERRRRREET